MIILVEIFKLKTLKIELMNDIRDNILGFVIVNILLISFLVLKYRGN
jgi:hypothetical protein